MQHLDPRAGRGLRTYHRYTSSGLGLPVSRHVAHEQDAGVHVEIEGRAAKAAVEQAEGGGAAGVLGDPDGETEADEEVSGRQVLQVDGDAAGRLLSLAEVNLQGETVEEESRLQRKTTPGLRQDLSPEIT